MERLYMGLDIGGSKSAVVFGRERGAEIELLKREAIETEAGRRTAGECIEALIGLSEEMLSSFGGQRPCAVGISCGGPLDSGAGIILSPPNLPGWDQIAICEIMTKHFRLPAFLQNDANACALAEWRFGAGRGADNMIFLTFGTGMGAGLILNGRLYEGSSGMAGEIGHIRMSEYGPVGYGKEGSFEGFCSGGGISEMARTLLLERRQRGEKLLWEGRELRAEELSAKLLAKAARRGDPFARSVFRRSVLMLGRGLSILIDLLNPDIIVIGSIYERCEDLFSEEMRRVISEEALSGPAGICGIRAAELGDRIGDYAALSVAVDGMMREMR